MRLPKWLSGQWSGDALRAGRRRSRRRARKLEAESVFLPQTAHSQLEDRRVLAVSTVVAGPSVTGALEGQTLTLSLASFTDDTGAGNTPHTSQINWGDGSSSAGTVTEPSGNNPGAVQGSHKYANEGTYNVSVSVAGADHIALNDTLSIGVNNVAPQIQALSATEVANENSTVKLKGTFSDPGVGDSHTVNIEWGTGDVTTFVLPAGNLTFATDYVYRDDNPTATTQDTYNIRVTVTDNAGDSGQRSVSTLIKNVAPTIGTINVTPMVDENGVVTLSGTFADPGTEDVHSLDINWGPGETLQTVTLPVGQRTFSITHQYLDDNPTATSQDIYNIQVTLKDDDLGSNTKSLTTTVKNVPPQIETLAATEIINENGVVKLKGSLVDPGTLDSFTLQINWGDGQTSTLLVPAGNRTFSIDHQYLDDNPTGTSQDVYHIQVSLQDDDLGMAVGSVDTLVKNVAPSISTINVTPMVDEHGTATLTGTFTDPGTQDVHTLVIDWGPGETLQTVVLPVGQRTFSIAHQYLDDNPTGTSQDTYNIQVTLSDDDLRSDTKSLSTVVKNVAPQLDTLAATEIINENGIVKLKGSVVDPGTLDSFTLQINWGDGQTSTLLIPAGERTFSIDHQYLDDNPTATNQDIYHIQATLVDDDLGMAVGSVDTLVKNVAPALTSIDVTPMIDENGSVTLTGTFTDPGTQDVDTLVIDWGAGESPQTVVLPVGQRTFSITHQYLDDNPTATSQDNYNIQVTLSDDDLGSDAASLTTLVKNVAPTIDSISVTPMVDENGTVTLTGTFTDPGTPDVHTLVIDWGPGETLQTVVLPVGQRTFSITHQYRDDNPTATSQDVYNIQVTLSDDDLGSDTAALTSLVKNVAPTLTSLDATEIINENGIVKLKGSFDDPGTLDTFTLQIDWGDGQTSTLLIPSNERTFEIDHQYLDDNPTATSQDIYHIQVTLLDDDLGTAVGSDDTLVKNVAPAITSIDATPMINENGSVTLTGAFTDPGTQDIHTLVIDWGAGESPQTVALPVGQRTFSITHQYLDDNPTATSQDTYNIQVTLSDDDLGSDAASLTTLVKNVAPAIDSINVTPMVDENGTVTLTGTFTDPGTQDVHTLVVDWGPGETLQTVVLPVGQRTFSITHQYRDDNPTATSQDMYNIQVTLSDDDLGSDTAALSTLVKNVAPTLTSLDATEIINENGVVKLKGSFDDPGTLDTFTLQIDWGDGQTSTLLIPSNERTFEIHHQYLDDNPTVTSQDIYHIQVTLLDDDLGTAVGSVDTLVKNVAPAIDSISVTPMVDENGTVTLAGTFTDPGTQDIHTLVIDWGAGESPQTVVLPVGRRTFSITHQYLDDNPTATDQDIYNIQVTLSDDDLGSDSAALSTLVKNVAPVFDTISVTPKVNENGTVTLTGAFTDVGSQDTHTLLINWGVGESPQTVVLPAGQRNFSITHQYRDDNPTATSQDIYTIQVTLTDDDLGTAAASLTTKVKNVPPEVAKVTVTPTINENGTVTLRGKFSDVGSLDSHAVVVNWGPGEGKQKLKFAPGTAEFKLTHQYLDDNPTGTSHDKISIVVQVIDDDGGIATRTVNTRVNNVPPVLKHVPEPFQVYEDAAQPPIVVGTFTDVGTRDTHVAHVNWGDGTPVQTALIVQVAGVRTLVAQHVFADDGFFTVTVTVMDDDLGVAAGSFVVESRIPTLMIVDVSPPFFPGRGDETGAGGGGGNVPFYESQTRDNGGAIQRSDPYGSGFRSQQADVAGTREKFYVLRIVHPDGSEGESIVLPETDLNDIPSLLRRLPDNHYRIYQMREDGSRRLVLDVFVVRGRAVDPNDSDRTQDRPPTSQAPLPHRDALTVAEALDRRWELWTAREHEQTMPVHVVRTVRLPPRTALPRTATPEPVAPNSAVATAEADAPDSTAANAAVLWGSAVAGAAVADFGAWKQQLDQAMERFRPRRPTGRKRTIRRSSK